MVDNGWWMPNPRFPAGYREKVEELATRERRSVASMIVKIVLEYVDASFDTDTALEEPAGRWLRTCGHPSTAPTRLRRSGGRVCWCGASVTEQA